MTASFEGIVGLADCFEALDSIFPSLAKLGERNERFLFRSGDRVHLGCFWQPYPEKNDS
jgi:hypothetical protein